jgi:hypothetical protein
MSASTIFHLVALVSGALLVVAVFWESFETFVSPRRASPHFRLTSAMYQVTWVAWRAVGRRLRPGHRRDGFLWVFGPLSLVAVLVLWTVLIVAGFTLLHWGAGSGAQTAAGERGWLTDFYLSGLAAFTMTGDVSIRTPAARVLTMIEAGAGLNLLAMVIGYLPMLAQAFTRREASVLLLDARAGSPPAAGALLLRYAGKAKHAQLARLLEQWEVWCSDLLETHLSFPALGYYRSQHANQSWVAALTAILDTCALVLTAPDQEPARVADTTFATARHAAVDLCLVLGISPQRSSGDRLPGPELGEIRRKVRDAGLNLGEGPEADATLRRLRDMYEPYTNALASDLLMPLPAWSVADNRQNWRGHDE